jgi:hypothetical protein
VRRGQQLIHEAELRVDDAEKCLLSARDQHTKLVKDAIEANSKVPVSGIRQARIEQAEAHDHLEATTAALDHIQATLAAAEESLRDANAVVLDRAKAVMAAETAHCLAEVQASMDEFMSKVAAFGWLVRSGIVDDSDPSQQPRHHDPFMRQNPGPSVEVLRSLGFSGWAPTWLLDIDRHPSMQSWRDALDRLQHDSDAPLPTG